MNRFCFRQALSGAAVAISLCMPATVFAQMEDVVIEATPVADGLYMITGRGGNLGLSVGDDATFLIDDQFAPLTEKIVAAIGEVTERPVDYVLNTHWHYDHVGGNENLGEMGALLLAHDNVRKRMASGQEMRGRKIDPAPPVALPVVTFNDRLTLHANGQTIRGIHVQHAHTDGDTVVYFEEANVFHMGDTYMKDRYPFVDLESGGNVSGFIDGSAQVLSMADADTKIIPGHGAVANQNDLQAFHDMLVAIRDRVAAMLADGKSLEEIQAAKPSAPFDARFDGGFITAEPFVESVYRSLTQ